MESIGAFLPLILIFGVFYILLIRPQQKKVKAHREMLNNLRRGDKIITSGGIIGTVNKVADNRELQVQVSENVEIKIAPGMVADLYISTEPEKKQPAKENRAIDSSKTLSSRKKTHHNSNRNHGTNRNPFNRRLERGCKQRSPFQNTTRSRL